MKTIVVVLTLMVGIIGLYVWNYSPVIYIVPIPFVVPPPPPSIVNQHFTGEV